MKIHYFSSKNAYLQRHFKLFLCALFFMFSIVGLQAQTERAALMALYDATGGQSWTSSTNWDTGAPIGQWQGVTTDPAGGNTNVVELELTDNNLNGFIPPQIGDLVNLNKIILNLNNFTGGIPDEICGLFTPNFQTLDLGACNLDGCIPSCFLDICDNNIITIVLHTNPNLHYGQNLNAFCDNLLGVELGETQTICIGDDITLSPAIEGDNYNCLWSMTQDGNDATLPFNEMDCIPPTFTSNDLGLGTYEFTLEIEDQMGCLHPAPAQDVVTIIVEDPCAANPISINLGDDAIVNLDEIFTLSSAIIGGNGGYNCNWSSLNNLTLSGNGCNPDFSSTIPGMFTYTVTVTDDKGCTAMDDINITVVDPCQVNPIGVILATTTTMINLGESATLTTQITADNGGETCAWTPSDLITPSNDCSAVFTPTAAGNFNICVDVTDQEGCTSSDTACVQIFVCDLSLSIPTITAIACPEGTGAIGTVTASGGSGPYSYSWVDNVGQPIMDLSDLLPGIYSLHVTDTDTGCTISETYQIAPYTGEEMDVIIMAEAPYCFTNINNQTITAIVYNQNFDYSNGAPNYDYEWSSDNGNNETVIPGSSDMRYTLMNNTIYNVTVTDNNPASPTAGCSTEAQITIDVGECPNSGGGSGSCDIDISGNVSADTNQDDMVIGDTPQASWDVTLSKFSPVEPYSNIGGVDIPSSYSYLPVTDTITNANGDYSFLNNFTWGVYLLEEDIQAEWEALTPPDGRQTIVIGGCQNIANADFINEEVACTGDYEALIEFFNQINGLTWDIAAPMYTWSGVTLDPITGCVTHLVIPDGGLTGTISDALCDLGSLQVLDLSNNDLSGCIPDCFLDFCAGSIDVNLSGNSGLPNDGDYDTFCTSLPLSVSLVFKQTIDIWEPLTLNPIITGGTETYDIQWFPTDYLDDATIASPIFTSPIPDIPGQYTYTYTVTVDDGCSITHASVNVTVRNPCLSNSMILDYLALPANCDASPCDGAILVIPSNPVYSYDPDSYTYSWSHDTTETRARPDNLCEATYDVTVTDQYNCTRTITGMNIEINSVLDVSTGYDPNSGTLTGDSNLDSKWKLVDFPSNADFPPGTINSGPAWVSPTMSGSANTTHLAKYITPFSSKNWVVENWPLSDQAYVFERTFCVCSTAPISSVILDFELNAQKWAEVELVEQATGDVTPLIAQSYTLDNTDNYTGSSDVYSNTLGLAPGVYTLRVSTRSDDTDLAVQFAGTITSNDGVIQDRVCSPLGTIAGFVYRDMDQDELISGLDRGLTNWVVELYDDADMLIATRLTDSNGFYSFSDLPIGDYTVKEVVNPSFTPILFSSKLVTTVVNEISVVSFLNDLIPGESPFPPLPTPGPCSSIFLGTIQINGIPAEEGDRIAVFDSNGNIVGDEAVIISGGLAYTNVSILGDDTTTTEDEGMNDGESFSLKLFDISENLVLDIIIDTPNTFTPWYCNNGAPMTEFDFNTVYNFLSCRPDIINLNAGWNLISFDVEPANDSVVSVISTLQPGNLNYVTSFDNGTIFYDPTLPTFMNTLNTFEPGFGYWIHVNTDDVLIICGEAIDPAFTLNRNAGWNLTAYIPQTPASPSDFYSDLIDANELIYLTGFDDGNSFYDPSLPPFLNTLSSLDNGFGYWIKVVTGGTFFAPPSSSLPPEFSTNPTSASGTLLGQAQISGITLGEEDSVAAFDEDGNCAGAVQILMNNGTAYINLPIYGDDGTSSNLDEGMNASECFSLKLWDASENTMYDLTDIASVNCFDNWSNTNGSPMAAPYNDPTVVYHAAGVLANNLIDFRLQSNKDDVLLKWTSTVEVNFKGYELQRSTSPKDFESIAWVDGKGGQEATQYTYLDKNIQLGTPYYYRLKMFNTDGSYSYSDILNTRLDNTAYEVFPNPFQNDVTIVIEATKATKQQLFLYNSLGELVKEETIQLEKGSNQITKNLNHLNKGVYWLVFKEDGKITEKMPILKM